MLPEIAIIRGVHPGDVLKRELRIQNLIANQLANSIDEHKQTISAVLNRRRSINPKLSIKLAKYFNVDEDYFMLLQASFDVKVALNSLTKNIPNLTLIRSAIFWDTSIEMLDWDKNKKAIIKRVLERGNKLEIDEIISFYGKETIKDEIKKMKKSFLPSFEINKLEYKLI